ncbi:MAG: hypothetical protein LBU78_05385 [Microbacterium sp.]|jgi:hypothetical protein|nr:hypothetical protein [Microbacterium sp.]
MGLIYSHDLYLPPRNIARALTALATHAPARGDRPLLDLTLPGGERLALPFTSRWEADPVDASASDRFELDTSILFDATHDEPLRAYAAESGLELTTAARTSPTGADHHAFGYVELELAEHGLSL